MHKTVLQIDFVKATERQKEQKLAPATRVSINVTRKTLYANGAFFASLIVTKEKEKNTHMHMMCKLHTNMLWMAGETFPTGTSVHLFAPIAKKGEREQHAAHKTSIFPVSKWSKRAVPRSLIDNLPGNGKPILLNLISKLIAHCVSIRAFMVSFSNPCHSLYHL